MRKRPLPPLEIEKTVKKTFLEIARAVEPHIEYPSVELKDLLTIHITTKDGKKLFLGPYLVFFLKEFKVLSRNEEINKIIQLHSFDERWIFPIDEIESEQDFMNIYLCNEQGDEFWITPHLISFLKLTSLI